MTSKPVFLSEVKEIIESKQLDSSFRFALLRMTSKPVFLNEVKEIIELDSSTLPQNGS